MSAVYPTAVDTAIDRLIHGGGIGWSIRAVLVDDTFVYDGTHDDIGDITGVSSDPAFVTIDRIENAALYINAVTFPDVPAGPAIRGAVFYLDGDVLLCHVDRRADTVPIEIVPDGGDITFSFDRLLKL
jgi:hypothetical protein